MSHDRRFFEILNPTLFDIRKTFETDFRRMTVETVDLADLERTRLTLIDSINRMLTPKDKKFLVAFKAGKPNWDHFSVEHVQDLPAIKWKQHNLDRMRDADRNAMIENLERFFSM